MRFSTCGLLITLVIALAILVPEQCLQANVSPRPVLNVWVVDCHNEHQFWSAYSQDKTFRAHLDRYVVVRRIPLRRYWLEAMARGIIYGPTFDLPGRAPVVGFRGTDILLAELGLPPLERATSTPVEQPPAQSHPPQQLSLDELKQSFATEIESQLNSATQQLRSETNELFLRSAQQRRHQLQQLQQQIQQTTNDSDLSDIKQTLAQFAQVLQQLQSQSSRAPVLVEHVAPGARPHSPQAEPASTPSAGPVTTTTPHAADHPSSSWWTRPRRWAGLAFNFASLAMAVGGGTAATGGTAAMVWSGLKLWRHFRGPPASATTPSARGPTTWPAEPPMPTPQIDRPAVTKTETRFVTVPTTDSEAEAYKEAIRRSAQLHPKLVAIFNEIESTAQQISHGHNVQQSKDRPPEARPGMWSD